MQKLVKLRVVIQAVGDRFIPCLVDGKRRPKSLKNWLSIYSVISYIINPSGFSAFANSAIYMDVRLLDSIELFKLCAAHRENSDAWAEFLHRYAARIKHFIHGAVRLALGGRTYSSDSAEFHESDLFQNIIIRLVENNCAAMKRFSGTSENALLAYLAVICRSSVLDVIRRNSASKRRQPVSLENHQSNMNADPPQRVSYSQSERNILMSELMSFARHTAQSHSGNLSGRDLLVFQLHFFEGLSHNQIAQCEGVNLTKAGVEKLLNRLVERVQFLATSRRAAETVR